MSVKLRQRAIEKGRKKSYYLDIYHKGTRKVESLDIFVYAKPANEAERAHNQQMKLLAEKRRTAREQQLLSIQHGIETPFQLESDFVAYIDEYIKKYKPNDTTYRSMRAQWLRFWPHPQCKPNQITESVCARFLEFLLANTKRETSHNYFGRFKRVIKQATKDGLFVKNPALEIRNKKRPNKEKDILTLDEIRLLAQTRCKHEHVKLAFLFCCYTGLRFVDVKSLKWENIKGDVMAIRQSKTDRDLAVSLSDMARSFLPETKPSGTVFSLPSHETCVYTVRVWTKRAGIEKDVTFHVARHSFGTNLYIKGVDTRTIAGLLGHTGQEMVMRYTRLGDQIKRDALKLLEE